MGALPPAPRHFALWANGMRGEKGTAGIVMMAAKLPEILLSPVSGTLVDMTSRKKVLVAADLVIGVLITAVSIACLAFPDDTRLVFGLLIASAVSIGICDSFFNPAVASFLPELVTSVTSQNLHAANAAQRFTTTAATFLGQCAAGALFAAIGAPLLFLANGVSYLFSAGSQACIASPSSRPAADKPGRSVGAVVANLKAGLAYVRDRRELRGFLFIICLYHFFVSPFTAIQLTTPKALHGRVFGLYSTLSTASVPFGMGFFGVAMDLLRKVIPQPSQAPAMIFLFCGVTLCAIVAFFMSRPSFRHALQGTEVIAPRQAIGPRAPDRGSTPLDELAAKSN